MSYYKSSGSTSASDLLEPSTLELRLPSAALAIPGVAAALGIRSASRVSSKDVESRVVIEDIGWEWETETIDFFDEEGCPDSREVREDYIIDARAVSNLYSLEERLVCALKFLGIPFDSTMADSIEGQKSLKSARLQAGAPPFCPSAGIESLGEISADELLDFMADAQTIEEMRQMVSERRAPPPALANDARLFAENMAQPGAAEFMEASAKLLDWIGGGTRIAYGSPQWGQFSSAWLEATWNGETPADRLLSLDMPLNGNRMFEIASTLLDQKEIASAPLAGSFLSLYCARHCHGSTVSPEAAQLASRCLQAWPEAAKLIHPRALPFFERDLAAHRNPESADAALAEAHWLTAQSAMARAHMPQAPSAPQQRRL